MSHQVNRIIIDDKQGRPICIDDRPGGWKITPRERDTIFQQFLAQFPNRDWSSERAWNWMKLEAKHWPLSAKRIRDFISEAIRAETGELDRCWRWWVGCSCQPGTRANGI